MDMQLVKQIRHVGYTSASREKALYILQEVLGIAQCRTQENIYPYIGAAIGYPHAHNRVAFAQIPDDPIMLEVLDYVTPRREDPPLGLSCPGQGWIAWETGNMAQALSAIDRCKAVKMLTAPHPEETGPWKGRDIAYFAGEEGMFFALVQGKQMTDSGCASRLDHAGYVVSDFTQVLPFLTQELGFCLLEETEGDFPGICGVTGWSGPIKTAVVELNDFQVELWAPEKPPAQPTDVEPARIGNVHLCCEVENIQQAYAYLADRGYRFPGPPAYVTHGANRGAYAIYLQTPNELRCELYQKPKS